MIFVDGTPHVPAYRHLLNREGRGKSLVGKLARVIGSTGPDFQVIITADEEVDGVRHVTGERPKREL